MFGNSWGSLPLITGGQSRAINGENPPGEKGKGTGALPERPPLLERPATWGNRCAGGDRRPGGHPAYVVHCH